MVGVKRDLQFGPLVAVGLGGVMVELLQDNAVRLAPVSRDGARAMLGALKGGRLLVGFRGSAGVDLDRLADTVARVSELAHDLADLVDEVDVNPVIATATGTVAADALIVLASGPASGR